VYDRLWVALYGAHGMAWHEGASWHHIYGHIHNGLYEPNMLNTSCNIYIIHSVSLDSSMSILFSKSALLNKIRWEVRTFGS
jgi:hypothetical protein